ncbi:MAG: hypothetical protein JXL97_09315 [Bacteroidales bacterium]|nr:hypothetical protein [Bacteroidales bacterium]
MKSKFLFLSFFVAAIMFFAACGGSSESSNQKDTNDEKNVNTEVDDNSNYIAIDWEGTYTFEEEAGGDRFYMYSLEVFLADGYYQGFYSIDGYQTMTRLYLYGEEEDGVLYMYFDSYGEDDMFQNGYNPNDLVLTISNSYDDIYIVNDGAEMEFVKQ